MGRDPIVYAKMAAGPFLRFAALLLLCALLGCSRSAEREIRLAVPRDAITFLPVHLAATLGYYQQNGLHVALSEVGGLAKGMEALLGGSVEVSAGSAEQVIQIAAEGRRVQSFLVIYQNTSRVLIVSPTKRPSVMRPLLTMR